MSLPVSSTSDLASVGWGSTAGVGYNFNRHHSFIGEFMWSRLYSTNEAAISGSTGGSSGGASDIYGVTGNYRFELQRKKAGLYFIGGGGWYFRQNNLENRVTVAAGTKCTPALIWWGAACASGIVTSDQTLSSYGTGALGWNGGVGFTWKISQPSYRFYVESRYHHAATSNIDTEFMNCTIGIRY